MGLIRGAIHGVGHVAKWAGHEVESGAGVVSDAASASGRLFADAYDGTKHFSTVAARDAAGAALTVWDHTGVLAFHGAERAGSWVEKTAASGTAVSARAVETVWRDTAVAGFNAAKDAGAWVGHIAESAAKGTAHGAAAAAHEGWKIIY